VISMIAVGLKQKRTARKPKIFGGNNLFNAG